MSQQPTNTTRQEVLDEAIKFLKTHRHRASVGEVRPKWQKAHRPKAIPGLQWHIIRVLEALKTKTTESNKND